MTEDKIVGTCSTHGGDERNVYTIVIVKLEGKRQLEIPVQ
jgi:hypothetical protein